MSKRNAKRVVNFDMSLNILMNRPITEEDYIVPGGFEFTYKIPKSPAKTFQFDFTNSSGDTNKDNPAIYEAYMENVDYDSFPELEDLDSDMLCNIIDIPELFVYTGEKGETDLAPAKALSCSITATLEDGTIEEYVIPDSVLDKARVASEIPLKKEEERAE